MIHFRRIRVLFCRRLIHYRRIHFCRSIFVAYIFVAYIFVAESLIIFCLFWWFSRSCVNDMEYSEQSSYSDTNDTSDESEVTLLASIRTTCFLRSEMFMNGNQEEPAEGNIRSHKDMEQKSKRYIYLLVTITFFYCVPAFQLVIKYLGILDSTGEQDICFYNNLCSLPLGRLMDFNHIISNQGYIIFGLAFICLVHRRQKLTSKNAISATSPEGTYKHYGLFYALGLALVMEGVLSASYHVCPNKANFQFDTTYMYTIAVLSYVKMYQFRHSFYMSEWLTFLLLAVVSAFVVVGLFVPTFWYTIGLSIVQFVGVVGFQLYLVYISRKTRESDCSAKLRFILWELTKELVGTKTDSPYLMDYHPSIGLFWWTVGSNVPLIIASSTYILVSGSNFASQVLYVLIGNLAIYVIYYFVMKVIHSEFDGLFSKKRPGLQPCIYAVLASGFMGSALYFFSKPSSTWDISPSASREMNVPCFVMGFYDYHDLWHLLSAPGLFFSFLVFLTIDDGLLAQDQKTIPMF